jgi:hypothetical protein
MRLNQLRLCMHADFHRKSFAHDIISDSRADNSGFASNLFARGRAAHQSFAAKGKIPPEEWEYGTACMLEPSEIPAGEMHGI